MSTDHMDSDYGNDIAVSVKRLDPELPLPAYARWGDGGMDLRARIDATLRAGERRLMPTGIAVAIPAGYAGFVVPRSGLAMGEGITVLNAPGLVDSGYRGELKVVLLNTDRHQLFRIRRGDRIAQLVVQRVERVSWWEVDELSETERGDGGFGHSGGHANLEGS
jgi:dUTP pyrophosphatase